MLRCSGFSASQVLNQRLIVEDRGRSSETQPAVPACHQPKIHCEKTYHFSFLPQKNAPEKRIQCCSRWWFQIFFGFRPFLGKIPILTNIFALGWNHQLVFDWFDMMFTTRFSLYTDTISFSAVCYLLPQRGSRFKHVSCSALFGESIQD